MLTRKYYEQLYTHKFNYLNSKIHWKIQTPNAHWRRNKLNISRFVKEIEFIPKNSPTKQSADPCGFTGKYLSIN